MEPASGIQELGGIIQLTFSSFSGLIFRVKTVVNGSHCQNPVKRYLFNRWFLGHLKPFLVIKIPFALS